LLITLHQFEGGCQWTAQLSINCSLFPYFSAPDSFLISPSLILYSWHIYLTDYGLYVLG